jgi:hypothetical protein
MLNTAVLKGDAAPSNQYAETTEINRNAYSLYFCLCVLCVLCELSG